MEEQELAAIRAHQADFELERDIELAELQRLEAEAKRRESEKLRRIEQEEAVSILEMVYLVRCSSIHVNCIGGGTRKASAAKSGGESICKGVF